MDGSLDGTLEHVPDPGVDASTLSWMYVEYADEATPAPDMAVAAIVMAMEEEAGKNGWSDRDNDEDDADASTAAAADAMSVGPWK